MMQMVQFFCWYKETGSEAVKTEAECCGMYYVNERWLGGMLTNFKTIQSRIKIKRHRTDGRRWNI